ncbi:hypothetical protein SUGI_1102770 [Cryptomeria japonica]|nr:hypothetical protein SUGI_1102770 [Cryptomeria japonica]
MAGKTWQILRPDFLAFGCSRSPYNNATLFEKNMNAALAAVVGDVVPSGFATTNEVEATDLTDSVYVLAQCRKDKSSADVVNCIKVATKQVGFCSNVTGASASYNGCFLHYENYNFYSSSYTDEGNKQVCANDNATTSNSFSATAQSLISDLCSATPQMKDYLAAQTRQGPSNTTVYGLASCIRSIQRNSCQECLSIAKTNINKCFPRSEGRAVDAGCYLRYDSKPFLPRNAPIGLADFLARGKEEVSSVVWIIIGFVGGVIILGFITCLIVFRKQKMRASEIQVDNDEAADLRGPEYFDFNILRKATDNFDEANKLGEGGLGQVFKGTLKNGNIVAIKKLTLGRSALAIAEFESGGKLISNVHHKNLVRLLGCCRQGQERLLVYEYMPNSSLDRILFGIGEHKKALSWKERFNIILGTARGLAYHHEEFHVCIIHRDIKSSNILLDDNFDAKIANFGLERLLPQHKTHVSTEFTGTL